MEVIQLTNPENGKTHDLEIIEQEQCALSAENVALIRGKLHSKGNCREVRMVSKKPRMFFGYVPEEERISRYYELWSSLKNSGIDTVPTLYTSFDRVIMPHLTADGSVFYGKHRGYDRDRSSNKTQPKPTDPIFMNLDPEEIESSARDILEKATKNKIILAYDDPLTLLIHPSGSWKLMALDISQTCLSCHVESYVKTKNDFNLGCFLSIMGSIRQGLGS